MITLEMAPIHFASDSATLTPAARERLDEIAQMLRAHPEVTLLIVGHTDSRGSEAYNQRLSEQRAESVANYLIQRGVSASRVTTSGRGELEPRGTNSTEAGRQLNRRVEIFLRSTQ